MVLFISSFRIVNRPPLAKQADVKWKDLANAQWVLPEIGSPLREMFTARGNLRPVVAVASSSFHQMRYVIGVGPLLGVLPHSIAQTGQRDGDLAILRPKQAAKVAPISLIARSDIEQPSIVAAFETIAIRTARELLLD